MPRIKTTPMVRAALWALRIYLLVLLSLIGFKFVRMFSDPSAHPKRLETPALKPSVTNSVKP
jgi:hypothetical protein